MLRRSFAPFLAVVALNCAVGFAGPAELDAGPTYDLTPRVKPGDASAVTATLDVGGEVLVPADAANDGTLPLSIVARLVYDEQIVAWSADSAQPARSVRRYAKATANAKTDLQSEEHTLAADRATVIAEVSDAGVALSGAAGPLTRNEFILLDAVGNTLVLDRLLPGQSLAEGEGWDHDAETIGALLGMDHVAVCEVRSVVTGEENRQVQIRMAGTVHGTVQGSATEMELRAAYLYHRDRGRISKFNLAIKEQRKAGDVGPGFDVVAKLAIVCSPVAPRDEPLFDEATLAAAAAKTRGELRQILSDAPERGFRFRHDLSWYVTAERRELTSLRLLDEGEILAHCNVSAGPPPSAEKPQTLPEFEREVCTALGDKVSKVAAATEWTTPGGNRCLAVFVNGVVKAEDSTENDVEVQWRYYRLSSPERPQATLSVTVEQAALERFADADRELVDSLELTAPPAKTAQADDRSPAK